MATKVHMEALSPTMEEGQVVRWLKSEGDEVTSGEVIAEIETDKATMELVARGDGELRKILLAEGGTAPVGEVIAIIAAGEEDIAALVGNGASSQAQGVNTQSDQELEAQATSTVEATTGAAATDPAAARAPDTVEAPPLSSDGRVKASPLARRLAEEAGLDLGAVSGSGPGGRVVKRDIEAAVASRGAAPSPAIPAVAVAPASEEDFEDVPLSQMRKTIAKRLVTSIGPVPHFFLTVDVDMTRTVAARRSINALLEAEGRKVSINDIVIRATAAALRRHPECNAAWQDGFIRRYNRVHIGVAVAIEDGLITPVVRDAHLKGVAQIGGEVRELAGRAREKKLAPDEYMGATFSISNLGMFGIQEFTAVINPPEAGILAIGALEERPVVVDGQVVVQPRMRITMSCDHRVIDGALGARFLATLRGMLEEPAAILI
jgi:pyruvate dehydrogenase E2 component (dihydrolipoamide acetyltransferase)